jgi:putative PIN family toxin of toxin-antitoxin system
LGKRHCRNTWSCSSPFNSLRPLICPDTNVLVSGLLWHGTPHTLLERVRNDAATLFTSPVLIAELDEVLQRRKFAKALQSASTSRGRILAEIRVLAQVIEPASLPKPVSRDPDDDHVIACAIAARPDAIVSGDLDLTDLGSYQGIPILSVHQTLSTIP